MLDFIVVGTAKAATTSLYYSLKKSPQVFLPLKETFIFSSNSMMPVHKADPLKRKPGEVFSSMDEYKKIFSGKPSDAIAGEIGTSYLYFHNEAIPKIKQVNENIKIVIILRNPVDRALSNYGHLLRSGVSNKSIVEDIDLEQEKIDQGWDFMWQITNLGFYAESVQAYFDNFKNVRIFFYENMVQNNKKFMDDFQEFIGIKKIDFGSISHVNKSGILKNSFLVRLLIRPNILKRILMPFVRLTISAEMISKIRHWVLKKHLKKKISFEKSETTYLKNLYKDDVSRLREILIKQDYKDLPDWLR